MNVNETLRNATSRVSRSLTVKLVVIGGLILVLLIPVSMVQSLIREREWRRQEVVDEITAKWGRAQTIAGPVMSVPYRKTVLNGKGRRIAVTRHFHLLPDSVAIDSAVTPQVRYRGLYRFPIWKTVRSMNSVSFSSSTAAGKFPLCLSAGTPPLPPAPAWPHPSFTGAFLPVERTLSEEGFSARWNVLHLNRNYPQSWTGSGHKLDDSAFGVRLFSSVEVYQKTMRTAKYALMFIVFALWPFCCRRSSAATVAPDAIPAHRHGGGHFLCPVAVHFRTRRLRIAYLVAFVAVIGLVSTYAATVLRSRSRPPWWEGSWRYSTATCTSCSSWRTTPC
jgi:inner membrane protein involved in colicin E2 resistance